MIQTLLAIALQAAAPAGQDVRASEDATVLKALSAPAPVAGGPLWVTLLTNRSIEALWRDDPARRTLQIEASNAGTSFYVMGLATRELSVRPVATLEQGGRVFEGRIVNVAHLDGQPVPEGASILGLIEFKEKIDPTRAFIVSLGGVQVSFGIGAQASREWLSLTAPVGQGF